MNDWVILHDYLPILNNLPLSIFNIWVPTLNNHPILEICNSCYNPSRFFGSKQLNVKEIAGRLGFLEASHFSNYFKKHTAQSPADYRKQLV